MIPPKDAFAKKDVRHGGADMVEVENTYIPHERIPLEFLKVNPTMENWMWNGTSTNGCPPKKPRIQNSLGHT
jgi:hypothetical protein